MLWSDQNSCILYCVLQVLLFSCCCFDFLYSYFPVTSSRLDHFSGTYFNNLYLRSPSGYVLLWLKTGGCLNSETVCLLQNVDNEHSPPPKKDRQWVIPIFLLHPTNHNGIKKIANFKMIWPSSPINFLGNKPYYFTIYFLNPISPHFKI